MKIFLSILAIVIIVLLIAGSVLILPFLLGSKIKSPVSRKSLEEYYAQEGSYEVQTHVIKNENGEERFILYVPTSMGEELPAVIWGNGTAALPRDYDGLHRHLASWGFIVINTFNSTTGTGEPLKDALSYLLEENERQESMLYQHLDKEKIGSAGHSQGSTGAINLYTNFEEGSYVKTIVSIALPALRWCDPEDVYTPEKIKVPFLILTGTLDFIISPWKSGLAALKRLDSNTEGWFLQARYCSHNESQENGGKYRGILTAWFRYQLMEDKRAGSIFDRQGEIYKNAGWRRVFQRRDFAE